MLETALKEYSTQDNPYITKTFIFYFVWYAINRSELFIVRYENTT